MNEVTIWCRQAHTGAVAETFPSNSHLQLLTFNSFSTSNAPPAIKKKVMHFFSFRLSGFEILRPMWSPYWDENIDFQISQFRVFLVQVMERIKFKNRTVFITSNKCIFLTRSSLPSIHPALHSNRGATTI